MIGVGVSVGINAGRAPAAAAGGSNSETQALTARMTTPPDPARVTLNDNLISALKNGATSGSNIWAKLDIFYVMAAADSQAATLDWKNLGGAGAFNLATSAGAPTFTADRGFTVSSTDKLTTGFAPSTNGVQAVTTSTHLMGWSRTSGVPASDGPYLGDTTRLGLTTRTSTTDAMLARCCNTSARSFNAGSVTNGSGMFLTTAKSTDNTQMQGYRNGAQIGTDIARSTSSAASSTALVAGPGTGQQWAAASWGAALSAAENLDFYNALNTYLVAIGAA